MDRVDTWLIAFWSPVKHPMRDNSIFARILMESTNILIKLLSLQCTRQWIVSKSRRIIIHTRTSTHSSSFVILSITVTSDNPDPSLRISFKQLFSGVASVNTVQIVTYFASPVEWKHFSISFLFKDSVGDWFLPFPHLDRYAMQAYQIENVLGMARSFEKLAFPIFLLPCFVKH